MFPSTHCRIDIPLNNNDALILWIMVLEYFILWNLQYIFKTHHCASNTTSIKALQICYIHIFFCFLIGLFHDFVYCLCVILCLVLLLWLAFPPSLWCTSCSSFFIWKIWIVPCIYTYSLILAALVFGSILIIKIRQQIQGLEFMHVFVWHILEMLHVPLFFILHFGYLSEMWFFFVIWIFRLCLCCVSHCTLWYTISFFKKKNKKKTINYTIICFMWYWDGANYLKKLNFYVFSLSRHWHFNLVFYRAFPFKKRCFIAERLWVDIIVFCLGNSHVLGWNDN